MEDLGLDKQLGPLVQHDLISLMRIEPPFFPWLEVVRGPLTHERSSDRQKTADAPKRSGYQDLEYCISQHQTEETLSEAQESKLQIFVLFCTNKCLVHFTIMAL